MRSGWGREPRRKATTTRPTPVIASAAKQSRGHKQELDCFVASAFARRRASADKRAPRNDGVGHHPPDPHEGTGAAREDTDASVDTEALIRIGWEPAMSGTGLCLF